ncbi:3-oxoacyl-[acyl-carrier-protein] synthase, mitochondrial, partial [Trichinella sp. T9]
MASVRVVVTGLGLVTPLGLGVELCWRRLLQGCIGAVELVDEKYRGCVSRVAALVPAGVGPGLFDRSQFSDGQWRRMTKATAYAMLAAGEALADAQWTPVSDEQREKTGVCVGVGMSDMEDVHEAGCLIDQQRDNRLSPYFIPRVLTNMTAGQLSVSYGLRGPNHCPSTACASGLHAIIDGMALIQRRQAELMLVGGAEAPVCKLSLVGFGRMGALSRSFNGRPAEASRPFDRRRDGFVIGEGAGMLLLERLEHALQRRAPHIYAELLGYGLSGDGLHLAAPCPYGSGAASCMRKALHDSAVPRDRISYVNAHATSTPLGDRAEFQAIQDVFRGSDNLPVIVSSNKGSIGHLLGAAGAVEAAFTVLSCFHGSVPPNVNLHQTDLEAPEIQLAPSDRAQHWTTPSLNQRKIALKNSFGFGVIIVDLLAIAADEDLEILQFDVKTAFLHGEIDELIFMEQPPCFNDGSGRVCKLQRALYGLKQAPRAWNKRLNDFLLTLNLQRAEADPCIYVSAPGAECRIILGLYVDDGLLCCSNLTVLKELVKKLDTEFEITVGDPSNFVGLEIYRDRSKRTIAIGQKNYIRRVLLKFNMESCKSVATPGDPSIKLSKDMAPS